jgi:hypothetical protein
MFSPGAHGGRYKSLISVDMEFRRSTAVYNEFQSQDSLTERIMAFSHPEYSQELVPGTEILLNTDGSSTRSGDAELVLVPEPSNQADDPLVWKHLPPRKYA